MDFLFKATTFFCLIFTFELHATPLEINIETWPKEITEALDKWKAGDQRKAEQSIDQIKYPNAAALFVKAIFERSRFDTQACNEIYDRLLKKYPNNWETAVLKYVHDIDILNTPEESYLQLHSLSLENPDNCLLNWIVGIMSRQLTTNPSKRVSLKPMEISQIGIFHYRKLLKQLTSCPSLVAQTYANLLNDVGMYEEELEYRKIAVEAERKSWSVDAMASLYENMGLVSEAESLYRECIRNKNNPDRAYDQLCKLLIEENRLDDAYKLAKEYVSNDYSIYSNHCLAKVCYLLKKGSEALDAYKNLYRDQSESKPFQEPQFLYCYVHLLERSQRWNDARVIASKYETDKSKYLSNTPIFQKIEQGSLKDVEDYLNRGENIDLTDPKTSSQSLLIKAVYFGKTEIALKILEKKPNLNATDSNGCTALMYAAQYGRLYLMERLLEEGANPWIQNKWGEKASDLCLCFKNSEGFRILTEKYPVLPHKENYESALYYASGWGYPSYVKKLLNNGLTPNCSPVLPKNPLQQSCLMNACDYNHTEVIRLLLQSGASLQATDKNGKTPLHYVAGSKEFPNVDMYKWMVEKGAKEETPDKNGLTPRQILESSAVQKNLNLILK